MKKINGLTTAIRMASLGVALTLTMLVSSGPLSARVRTMAKPTPGPVLTTPAQEAKTISITLKDKRYNPFEITVKDGDILKICNEDNFYHAPFSYSKYNQFETSKGARLRPGACMTHVVRNPTQNNIIVALFDELHSMEKMILKVRPAGAADANTGGDDGPRPCTGDEAGLFDHITGSWKSISIGPNITISGSCEKASGTISYREYCERPDAEYNKALQNYEVAFTGRIEGGSLFLEYKKPRNSNEKGTGSCTVGKDGILSCSSLPCNITAKKQ